MENQAGPQLPEIYENFGFFFKNINIMVMCSLSSQVWDGYQITHAVSYGMPHTLADSSASV